jgi:hypothetical protein
MDPLFAMTHDPFDEDEKKDYDETLNEYFDSGLDIEDSLSIPHPGVHRHIHIAEAFYEKYGEA